ncbi:sortase [Candidatus Woesebacteria bacterium]|nr:MAG: sortase [Candidatus Woesebacteria bacterium]
MKNLLANVFIVTGICMMIVSAFYLWQRYNPNRLAFSNVAINTYSNKEDKLDLQPVSLSLSTLDINLSVFPARVNEGRWETTTEGVSFLVSSATPGQNGNSVFYGHNYKNILGNLAKAQPGDLIKIVLSDGTTRSYKIEYVQIVSPDQMGILDPTNDERITLYTCSGFLDSKRLVVTALPVLSI